MYIVLLLNLRVVSKENKKVDVNEHEKLSKFTKILVKVKEEKFYCCSTFQSQWGLQ
jgi:hypothetical protein